MYTSSNAFIALTTSSEYGEDFDCHKVKRLVLLGGIVQLPAHTLTQTCTCIHAPIVVSACHGLLQAGARDRLYYAQLFRADY